MTVDLSTLKVGDKVIHRDGEKLTVIDVELSDDLREEFPVYIRCRLSCGTMAGYSYTLNGYYYENGKQSVYDIMEVIK